MTSITRKCVTGGRVVIIPDSSKKKKEFNDLETIISGLTTWVEVDPSAITHNIKLFQSRVSENTLLMAVVKGFAYGHDPSIVAPIALEAGAQWLGVNSIEEAHELRSAGINCPVLILGHVRPARYGELSSLDASITLYNLNDLKRLGDTYKNFEWQPKIHVKVETGLNRQGASPDEALSLLEKANKLGVIPEGAHTHFANIEDTVDHGYAESQLRRFEDFAIRARGKFPKIILHTACSAAAMLFPKTHFNMVRTGISMYGLWPSRETKMTALMSGNTPPELIAALTWKSRVAQIKPLFAGDRVGYGCSHVVTRDGLGAIIPVGYYEGYDRSLSNKSSVLVGGLRCPVLGRVCMNMIIVDVSHVPGVDEGDEVVLIGSQGQERITAEELASHAGTINYEIVTRINRGIRRIQRKISFD